MKEHESVSDQYSKNIFLTSGKQYLSESEKIVQSKSKISSSESETSDSGIESDYSDIDTNNNVNNNINNNINISTVNNEISYCKQNDSSSINKKNKTSNTDLSALSINKLESDAICYQSQIASMIKKLGDKKDTIKNDLQSHISEYIKDIDIDWSIDHNKSGKLKQYDQISQDVSDVPKIMDILELSMPYDEKCDLFEKILVLNNITPMTLEFFELKKYIVKIIKNYNKFKITDNDYRKYKIIEESLAISDPIKPIEFQILDLDISDYNKSYIYSRYKYLLETGANNLQSNNKLKQWIESIINIPTKIKPMRVNANDSNYVKSQYLLNIKNMLDKEIYGLVEVKEKILFLLNNRITNRDSKGLNFALSGPPGVAKTSIINVLSRSIDLPFFQINAAGMKDSSFLLGHNYTYEGSSPGVIVQGLSAMKYKNGIIYFDEFDKISNTEHGIEISRTLLHITDFSQNNKFHDRYISEQIDIDLSNIWFIYSMNNKNLIDPTLRDRISIIEIEGYDKNDKKIIANKYLLPNALENIDLSVNTLQIENDALEYLIDMSGDISITGVNGKSGVRQLKQLIDDMLMKINFLRTIGDDTIDLSFSVDNFKLPIIITKKIIIDLKITKKHTNNNNNYENMYS